MSTENIELTHRACEAFNTRDWRTFSELMHAEIEVQSRLVAMEGGYRGEQGLRRWRDAIMGSIPDYTVEIEEIRDLGDVALMRNIGTGHGAASDTPVHDRFWQAAEWRDGLCIWWRNCSTEAEALEAIAERTGTDG